MGSYKLPITGMTYSVTIWEDIWTIGEVGDLFPHSGTTRCNSASDLLQGIVYGYSRDTLLNALLPVAAKKWKIRTGKTHLCCMGNVWPQPSLAAGKVVLKAGWSCHSEVWPLLRWGRVPAPSPGKEATKGPDNAPADLVAPSRCVKKKFLFQNVSGEEKSSF